MSTAKKEDCKHIVVGKVGKPFGYQGWFKIWSYTDPKPIILDYLPWTLSHEDGLQLKQAKYQGKQLLGKLDGIDDEQQAKIYTHALLSVPRSILPKLEEGYYWNDLIGLEAYNLQGIHLGRIDYLFTTGANDICVIQGEKRQHLIPYTPQVIQQVLLEKGHIIVDWDENF
jgi:16S rRNA processing protein RimM